MPTLKGLKKLVGIAEDLQALAEEVRVELEEKQEWFEGKSDKWQEGEKGEEWKYFFDEVEEFLDEIDNMSSPDFN